MAEMLLLMMMVMVMVVVGRRSHVVDRHGDRRRVKRFGENSARNPRTHSRSRHSLPSKAGRRKPNPPALGRYGRGKKKTE